MIKPANIAVLGVVFSFIALTANAHPGPEILTAGGAETRTATTPGVSVEQVKGVHIVRGTPALLGAKKAAQAAPPGIELSMVWPDCRSCPSRTFRRLRTQGFYSGIPYRSRRYTQGFYSGNN